MIIISIQKPTTKSLSETLTNGGLSTSRHTEQYHDFWHCVPWLSALISFVYRSNLSIPGNRFNNEVRFSNGGFAFIYLWQEQWRLDISLVWKCEHERTVKSFIINFSIDFLFRDNLFQQQSSVSFDFLQEHFHSSHSVLSDSLDHRLQSEWVWLGIVWEAFRWSVGVVKLQRFLAVEFALAFKGHSLTVSLWRVDSEFVTLWRRIKIWLIDWLNGWLIERLVGRTQSLPDRCWYHSVPIQGEQNTF